MKDIRYPGPRSFRRAPQPSLPPSDMGRNVKVGDVAPFAKRTCRPCSGRGEIMDVDRGARICGCALKRFLKANKEKVIAFGAELHWRKACEPEMDFTKVDYAELEVRARALEAQKGAADDAAKAEAQGAAGEAAGGGAGAVEAQGSDAHGPGEVDGGAAGDPSADQDRGGAVGPGSGSADSV